MTQGYVHDATSSFMESIVAYKTSYSYPPIKFKRDIMKVKGLDMSTLLTYLRCI